MANTAAFEEVLRLVLETSGTEGVDELRRALLEMGTASEDAVADTTKLVDKLADLSIDRTNRAVDYIFAHYARELSLEEVAEYQIGRAHV